MNWSLENGAAGITPNGQEIDRRGAIVMMAPDLYLKIAPNLNDSTHRPESDVFLKEASISGKKTCPPLLKLNISKGKIECVGHDGRHRTTFMKSIGAREIPVMLMLYQDFTPMKDSDISIVYVAGLLGRMVKRENLSSRVSLKFGDIYFRGCEYRNSGDRLTQTKMSAQEFLSSKSSVSAKLTRNHSKYTSRSYKAETILINLLNGGDLDSRFVHSGSGANSEAFYDSKTKKTALVTFRFGGHLSGLIDVSKEVMILARKIAPKNIKRFLPEIERVFYSDDGEHIVYMAKTYKVAPTVKSELLRSNKFKTPKAPKSITNDPELIEAFKTIYIAASSLGVKVSLDLGSEYNYGVSEEKDADGSPQMILLDPILCITDEISLPKIGKIRDMYFKVTGKYK